MAYRVELTPRAQGDLDKLFSWMVAISPNYGPLWFDRLERAILSLSSLPQRCVPVPVYRARGVRFGSFSSVANERFIAYILRSSMTW